MRSRRAGRELGPVRWRATSRRVAAAACSACLLGVAQAARGQEHEHGAEQGGMQGMAGMPMSAPARPLGIPAAREGSGTSWLPDASPMYMLEASASGWTLDLMANVFAQWIDERGARGGQQFGSVNWIMGMARRPLANGELRGRAMFSLEPLTLEKCGYPDLLATGELCHGAPLHDRQHPHDLFMELSAAYARPVSGAVALEAYGGVAGEPALGPTAFPHRPSAMPSPIAPISHHWLDSTHISFGVVTAGVFGRRWKVEGSAFNGREPDERRLDLDLGPLDSFSGRAWYLPDEHWALQVSAGHLREAEQLTGGAPRADVDRATASATHEAGIASDGHWSTTAGWGRNWERGHATNAVLVESTLELHERDVVFARLETVQKTAEELVIDGAAADVERWVTKLALTYVRQLRVAVGPSGVLLGLGAGASLSFVPSPFDTAYGGHWPYGFVLFVSVRPAPMRAGGMAGPMSHAM